MSVFVIATTLTAVIAISLQFYFSRTMAMDSALSRYQNAANSTGNFLKSIDASAFQATQMLANYPALTDGNWVAPGILPLFSKVMKNNNMFYAIYIGFENGNFFEVVNLDNIQNIRRQLKAGLQDRWVVISVRGKGDKRQRRFEYYDNQFRLRETRTEKSDYDPSLRPWFTNAAKAHVSKTDPYLFQHLQLPGQSYSIRLPDADAVLTVDITLSSLSDYLMAQDLGNQAEVYMYQKSGELIASNLSASRNRELPEVPVLELSTEQQAYIHRAGKIQVSNEMDWPPIDYAISGQPQGYSVDIIRMIARMTGMEIEFVNGYTWPELKDLFINDEIEILQPVFASKANAALGILSDPVLSLSYAAVTRPGKPDISYLEQLSGRTIAIPAGWTIIPVVHQLFPGIRIVEVSSPKAGLQSVKQNKAYAALDASIILHYTADYYFIDGIKFHENIGVRTGRLPSDLHFLVHRDDSRLAEILNSAIARIGDESMQALKNRWCHAPGSDAGWPRQATVPYPKLISMTETIKKTDPLARTMIDGIPMFTYITRLRKDKSSAEFFAVLTPAAALLAPSMKRVRISTFITILCMLALLPVTWLFAAPIVRPIKRLALENDKIKRRRYADVTLYDSAIAEIYELSRSIVDMADTIKQHEEELKTLMDSLIQLIAQAIDDKSAFTAGHCARVPELAILLVDAASSSRKKPFDQFHFESAEEYREFRMAAWLHDCGKITTPDYIVNKATKLETIYNRIHEIRMRFEVLWRDAEIEYLKQVYHHPEDEALLRQALEKKRWQLQADFEFIANANTGGESMTQAQLDRLQELAMKTWQRHFDDRLGISSTEAMRYPAGKQRLPATEPLLADKPQHIIERRQNADYGKQYGIKMEIPQHLYNLGELYNLSVSQGTLTKEDRFKIQEHIISTIKMLESLPFPDELARVPRYAATHHETLKGDGYPRKLTGADLSIPERIIAVADIFEALTASDRPYKKAKKLSEAIHILYQLTKSGHIDRDVFELFLTSKVYLTYGKRFLKPEQLDVVPIVRYLRRP
ncbi:MAG: transporter substrate-binding domain-containing protein [Desulfobacterales bacterium]|nr:transporter substrate-binding domain-containing protein [Desulfobacterales bacterium]